MILLDGRKIRDEIRQALRIRVEAFSPPPCLAIVEVGENSASENYIRQKKLFGESVGVLVRHIKVSATSDAGEIISLLEKLNAEREVHGIIVQLPLPSGLPRSLILDTIAPEKDVDGLGSVSLRLLWENKEGGYVPATTKGILSLLAHYDIPVAGKHVVVVGRSFLVGKPTALALLNHDATVTIAHTKTRNLPLLTKQADILIVAAGKPHFIQHDHVREGQVIIDVGITAVTGEKLEEELEGKTIAGDVHADAVKHTVAALSPVPGGVGPMTVASLFENLVGAYERQR